MKIWITLAIVGGYVLLIAGIVLVLAYSGAPY